MGNRCENCERAVAELRAEYDQLRQDFMHRVEDVLDQVVAKSSVLLTNMEAKNVDLLAGVDRRVRRLFETLSKRLHLPPRPMNEEPPRMH